MTPPPQTPPPQTLERYRIAGRLGQGGMGEVVEAVDTVTGKALALKSLRQAKTVDRRSRRVRLFEQEFYTLSQLRHPCVVEVYDFCRGSNRIFYTMELLNGGDLHELSPLPWKRVCALLCDVCSALSLLHSRRLVHRDLTTRNVRCTRDGTAKLIDFGAMAPFGTSKHIIGTPAFTAPEVLTGQALDARTDLFSLGATAYYALTGRHAYPAATLAAQHNAWRSRPQPPSRFAEVPRELDELVTSLLQIAPLARPRTAAEVMERLSVIGDVPLEGQVPAGYAYLLTPTLVGRDAPLLRVRKQLLRASRGRGGVFLITGPAGVGRSRFLEACVFEGTVLGTLVLRADSRDGAAPWGGARALCRQLHDLVPGLPSSPLALDESQFTRAGPLAVTPEARSELQAALYEHLLDASRDRGLMLAIDDLDALDEPSASLVALLAEHAARHGISVMATADLRSEEGELRALGAYRRLGGQIVLAPLAAEQTLQLLLSVFGDVPNVRLLADRLHTIARGRPRAVMQLAQHLVERRVVHFQAGRWTLPSDPDAAELPVSLMDVLRARVVGLSPSARWLAQALAISGRISLTPADCAALVEDGDTAGVLRALDELVVGSVLDFEADSYAFTEPGWSHALLEVLEPEQRRRLHASLALLCESDGARFQALQHTWWADHRHEALEGLLAFTMDEGDRAAQHIGALIPALQHTPVRWRPVMEEVIAWCEERKAPRVQRTRLRLSLILRAIAFSQPYGEHLSALLRDLRHDAGLDIYLALDESLPASARLESTLECAQRRYDAAESQERGLAPQTAIEYMRLCCHFTVSLIGRSLDFSTLERVPRVSVLAPTSVPHQLADANVRSALHACAGRMERARENYLNLLERFRNAKGTGAAGRVHMGYTYAVGLIEAGIGLPLALERADVIESHPAFEINAWHVRRLYALRQGDFESAEGHERRIERIRLRNAPPAMYDGGQLWVELRSYTGAEDLERLTPLITRIEEIARQLPSWEPMLRYARGCHHLQLRGLRSALSEMEAGLSLCEPGRHPAWPALAGGCISALRGAEEEQAAVERGRAFLDACRQVDLGYQAGYVERALALAEVAIGEHQRAIELADSAIETLELLGATGLDLGASLETRARVALAMKDEASFEHFARQCASQYRAGHNPALTVKYERLLEDARRRGIDVSGGLTRASLGPGLFAGSAARKVLTALEACEGSEQRAREALRCLIDHSSSVGGFLYTMGEQGAVQAAARCGTRPPQDMDERVQAYLSAELAAAAAVTVSAETDQATQSGTPERWQGAGGDAFAPVLMSHVADSGSVVTGLVVLCVGPREPVVALAGILPALSQALCRAGDVVPYAGAS
ncbi:MAG: serine/threonine-protein kinase [Myxococcales bacterium]|nr:serine/threonine-protein kinase [Myxococcales bacterium]